MNTNIYSIMILGFAFLLGANNANASSAQERAAEIKIWRAQCAELDPDLQIGYIEEAIQKGDQSILRVCLRQAFASDATDTRNLALRAAIASTERLVFETTRPAPLTEEIEKASRDKKRLADISNWHITRIFNSIRGGFSFVITDAELGLQQSTWSSIAGNTKADDRFAGQAIVVGPKINWTGKITTRSRDYYCDVSVELTQAARLEGLLICENYWAIPISAPLL